VQRRRDAERCWQLDHADCDACHDMASCGAELDAAGAHSQVVSLKNGVIFVYTADTPAQVRAVQAAMVRRTERLNALLTAGDKAKLCDECKLMRGRWRAASSSAKWSTSRAAASRS